MTLPNAKRIVLTGAGRGLGRAMAGGFIIAGHTVIACSRSQESIARLRQRFNSPHRFDAVDVADDDRVAAWAHEVLAAHGPPDLLINNAAVINENAPLWEVTAADFDRLVDVNVKGVANVIRHFVPAMIQRGQGVIVNFSSGWGRSASPEVAPYCASKWAVEGLTRALAEELPDGLAAVPLNPGVIHTQMLESCFGAAAASYPKPQRWAERTVPFLLQLGPKDNGHPLTAPA
jgi:NAD(P)-dependent dehydrogenase (short-subunit alcohol dehydrogenase family)